MLRICNVEQSHKFPSRARLTLSVFRLICRYLPTNSTTSTTSSSSHITVPLISCRRSLSNLGAAVAASNRPAGPTVTTVDDYHDEEEDDDRRSIDRAEQHPVSSSPLSSSSVSVSTSSDRSSLSSSSSSSSSLSVTSPIVDRRYVHYRRVSWRFGLLAKKKDIVAALDTLIAEGKELHRRQQIEQHKAQQQQIAQLEQKEAIIRSRGKIPPPRPATLLKQQPQQEPQDDNNNNKTTNTNKLSSLDYLRCHPYSTYLELMRSFAGYGDVSGCHQLLTKLYQLAMTDKEGQLLPYEISSNMISKTQRRKLQHTKKHHSSNKQRYKREREEQKQKNQKEQAAAATAAEHNTTNDTNDTDIATASISRSRYTPTPDILAAVMTSYTLSDHPYPLHHHHSLFEHYHTLHIAPNTEFYHSLLIYHSIQHTVESYLSALALLSRSSIYPPTITHYIDAIRHYGLVLHNTDAALQLFISLSSLFIPNAAAYNKIMMVFAEEGEYQICYRLMNDMIKQQQIPSTITYNSLILACQKSRQYTQAEELFRYIRTVKRSELEKYGLMNDAVHVAMIRLYIAKDDLPKAMEILDLIQSDGLKITQFGYIGLIKAYIYDSRDVQQAYSIYYRMMYSDPTNIIDPNSSSYLVIFELLALLQHWSEAKKHYEGYKKWITKYHQTMLNKVFTLLLTTISTTSPSSSSSTTSLPSSILSSSEACLELLFLLREQYHYNILPNHNFMINWLKKFKEYSTNIGLPDLGNELKGFYQHGGLTEINNQVLDNIQLQITHYNNSSQSNREQQYDAKMNRDEPNMNMNTTRSIHRHIDI